MELWVCFDCYSEIMSLENEFILKEKKDLVEKNVKFLLDNLIIEPFFDYRTILFSAGEGIQKLSLLPCDCCEQPCFGYRLRFKIIGKINNSIDNM
jgi:hypothetical protein